jgi:hypothetical protein
VVRKVAEPLRTVNGLVDSAPAADLDAWFNSRNPSGCTGTTSASNLSLEATRPRYTGSQDEIDARRSEVEWLKDQLGRNISAGGASVELGDLAEQMKRLKQSAQRSRAQAAEAKDEQKKKGLLLQYTIVGQLVVLKIFTRSDAVGGVVR